VSRRLLTLLLALVAAAVALTGTAQAKVVTRTFSSGDINTVLPAPTTSGLGVFQKKVKARGKIVDVDLNLRLTNVNAGGDLRHTLSLRAPSGRTLGLVGQATGAGYGSGASSCAGTPTTFDDEASIGIGDPGATSPYAGHHRPSQPLALLDGSSPQGTWDFLITTNYGAQGTSTLNCWSLTISYKEQKKKKKKK
jgi:hypothetical protein